MLSYYWKGPRVVYVSNPKTGSKSVIDTLSQEFGKAEVARSDRLPTNWPFARSFCTFREPLSRFVSTLKFCRERVDPKLTASDILMVANAKGIPYLREGYGDSIKLKMFEGIWYIRRHSIAQTSYLVGLNHATYVLRTHKLQKDLNELLDSWGLPELKLQRKNKSKDTRGPQEILSAEEIQKVRTFYQNDIKAYSAL